MSARLAVVGGGVIGSFIAWRAAQNGWSTTVHDSAAAGAGSSVAGGMLGCAGEARPGEDAQLRFALAAAARWPALLAGDLADVRVADETLLVAGDSADAQQLTTTVGYLADHGIELTTLNRNDIRSAAPGLAPVVRRGHLATVEGAVDNRALLRALRRLGASAGVRTIAEDVADVSSLDADQVVVATGAWTPHLLPGAAIRAEKGEILRLVRPRTAPPPPPQVVRARWRGRSVYVVPRPDGVVVGATQYEIGDRFDIEPRVGGVTDLLTDATELMPALAEYRLVEVGAGLRPLTPDGLPLVGRLDDRTIVAAGHGRNGILTAPLTADLVVGLLGRPGSGPRSGDAIDRADPGDSIRPWADALDPRRFQMSEALR